MTQCGLLITTKHWRTRVEHDQEGSSTTNIEALDLPKTLRLRIESTQPGFFHAFSQGWAPFDETVEFSTEMEVSIMGAPQELDGL